MLKTYRAWALALATLTLAPMAHAGCANPTLTGLTGKDAGNATQTMSTLTQTYQMPLHVDNGWTGSAYSPLNLDVNCNLDVNIQAAVPLSLTGSLPPFASTPTFNLGTLNGAATASNQTSVQSSPGTAAGTAVTIQGSASGVAVPISAAALPLATNAATASNQTATQSAPGTSAGTAVTIQGSASGVAVPVNAASLPLPAGAATAANQTATQSAAGTSSGTAVTIQGSASGVAVPVTAASLPLPSGAAQDGTDGSGITQPTGGVGIRGWLSGIYKSVTNTLAVKQVDSGGVDATDTVHHSVNVTAPLVFTMLGQQVAYNVANAATDGQGTAAYPVNGMVCAATSTGGCNSSNANSLTFARGGAHITGWHVWANDKLAITAGTTATIRSWSQAPNITGGDHDAYTLTGGSQYWTGDWNCTFNTVEGDGVDGYCNPVGAAPDIPFTTLYVLVFFPSGTNTTSGTQLVLKLTPLGSM